MSVHNRSNHSRCYRGHQSFFVFFLPKFVILTSSSPYFWVSYAGSYQLIMVVVGLTIAPKIFISYFLEHLPVLNGKTHFASVFSGCKLERKEEWLDLYFARNKTSNPLPPRLQNSSLMFDIWPGAGKNPISHGHLALCGWAWVALRFSSNQKL